jgi:signal transduction histidine kinase
MDFLKIFKRSQLSFGLACVAALALMFISEGSYWQSVGTLDKLDAMATARTRVQDLLQNILDAETGQRGYLLTGRKEYLQPYEQALRKFDESFEFLNLHYGGKPESQELLGQMRALTQTKMAGLAQTINLYDEGKGEEAIKIVSSGLGKNQMDAIRALSTNLQNHEISSFLEGKQKIDQTLMFSRLGVAALTAISLLALSMYLRQAAALIKYELELKRIGQARRDQLEIEVIQRTAQLIELTYHLQTAREDERNRLARNLHDDLGSLLTAAKLDAARIKPRLAGSAPETLELLAHLVGTLNSSIALGRRIIEDLRPSALGNLGLVATLEILAQEFAEHSGVEVHCALEPARLNAAAELMVYRLVQKAITNITKYARARQVWITLTTHDGQVAVSVQDDGVGFDTAVPSSSAYGLMGMRYRVQAEGGVLNVASTRGAGTLIQANLPESKPGTFEHM